MIPDMMPWFERKFSLDLPDWRFPLELERLRGLVPSLQQITRDIDQVVLRTRIGEKWSIQEHVGHLLDLEALGLGRIDDFEAGLTQLRPADLANTRTHAANHNANTLNDLLAQLAVERLHFVRRLEGLSAQTQLLRALHPRIQQMMRPVDLMHFIAEHDTHHLAMISFLIRSLNPRRR